MQLLTVQILVPRLNVRVSPTDVLHAYVEILFSRFSFGATSAHGWL